MTSRIDGVGSKCEFITAKCADEKSVAIVGVRNVHGDLVVPAELGGFSVVGIRNSAFQGCTALKSVEIPDSVTSIGNGAFRRCRGLMDVAIPSGVESIGRFAFEECISLASVAMPSSVERIGYGAFNDTALKTICISTGDSGRIKKLLEDSGHKIGGIKFVEREADVQ